MVLQAGIDNCRLRLVLEPEAASVYCQANCTVRNIQAGGIVELRPFPADHTYIVADLGGKYTASFQQLTLLPFSEVNCQKSTRTLQSILRLYQHQILVATPCLS